MARRKIKITTHGGYRQKLDYDYAEQRLLDVLWERAGGPGELRKKTGILAQAFGGWRRKGYVPLNKVGPIARLLKVPIYALNFTECHELLGKGPTWGQVLKRCRLTDKELDYIEDGERGFLNN